MDLAGISLTESEGQVFLNCQPLTDRAELDVATLHSLLLQSGFDGYRVNEPALAQAAQDCNTRQAPFAHSGL